MRNLSDKRMVQPVPCYTFFDNVGRYCKLWGGLFGVGGSKGPWKQTARLYCLGISSLRERRRKKLFHLSKAPYLHIFAALL